MCTRYAIVDAAAVIAAVARILGATLERSLSFPARYNVAPSQFAPVFRSDPAGFGARLGELRWGLVPPADRGQLRPRALANARSETMNELPAFRAAARERRCVVPLDGFYEFKDLGRAKEPYLFDLGGQPFALAGLWEPAGPGGPDTFCLVTMEPNAVTAPIHNRMPVILTGEGLAGWLGRAVVPPLPAALRFRRVNSFVNNSRNEGPQCQAQPEAGLPELW